MKGKGATERMASVKKAIWGMLKANDAGFVSKAVQGQIEMMTVSLSVRGGADRTVSSVKKTLTIPSKTPHQLSQPEPLVDRGFRTEVPTGESMYNYFDGIMDENAHIRPAVERGISFNGTCCKRIPENWSFGC